MRYRDILAQSGVKLQLLPTTGGLENLARLHDKKSGVSVAFIPHSPDEALISATLTPIQI
jgi:hypothetical protein